MGDWADDLANEWVRAIKAGTLDEPALAMKLRNIEVRVVNDLTEDLRDLNRLMTDKLEPK